MPPTDEGADRHAPPWARRHSAAAWAGLLAGPAAHGWTPRDLTALIGDWTAVTGGRIPDNPHKPIGLLGAILAWYGRERLEARAVPGDEVGELVDRGVAAELDAAGRGEGTGDAAPDDASPQGRRRAGHQPST